MGRAGVDCASARVRREVVTSLHRVIRGRQPEPPLRGKPKAALRFTNDRVAMGAHRYSLRGGEEKTSPTPHERRWDATGRAAHLRGRVAARAMELDRFGSRISNVTRFANTARSSARRCSPAYSVAKREAAHALREQVHSPESDHTRLIFSGA